MTISQFDILKVTANLSYAGSSLLQNVYGVRVTDLAAATQQQVRESIARYLEAIYSEFNARLGSAYTYTDISIFNNTTDAPEPDALWPTLAAGTDPGEPIPEGCSAFAKGLTGVSRRQGRKYWPPPTEIHQNGGVISIAASLDYADAAADWTDEYTDGTTSVVLQPGVIPTDAPTTLTAFTDGVFVSRIAYQRRRKVGVGL